MPAEIREGGKVDQSNRYGQLWPLFSYNEIKSLFNSLVLHFSSIYLILLYVEWFLLSFIIVENHLSHQHHQFVHISPGLQHKVTWMACH